MQLVKAMVFIMKERMMKKLKGKKGFTLGELLIVVGIISVLVAISIPIFASQLEKAREATDAANIRSQYAQVMTDAIDTTATINGKERYGAISLKQKKDGWQNAGLQANLNSTFGRVVGSPAANGSAWVEFDGNVAILHFEGSSGSGSGESGNNPGESGNSGNSGGNTGGTGVSAGSNRLSDVLSSAENITDKSTYEGTLVPGKVYQIGDSTYVFRWQKEQLVNKDSRFPDIDNAFVKISASSAVYTEDDYKPNVELKMVHEGDFYQSATKMYVRTYGAGTWWVPPEKDMNCWLEIRY